MVSVQKGYEVEVHTRTVVYVEVADDASVEDIHQIVCQMALHQQPDDQNSNIHKVIRG